MKSFKHLLLPLYFALIGQLTALDTFYWGVDGQGGSGTWTKSESNWWNGSANVVWTPGARAVFGGTGGIISTQTFLSGPSEMVFEAAGYTIDKGWLFTGANLTITTHHDATLTSTLSSQGIGTSPATLVKNGAGKLSMGGANFLDIVLINEGEFHLLNSSSLAADTVLAAGTTLTLGIDSSTISIPSLSGYGTVRPDDRARTVTYSLNRSGEFFGDFTDNGEGILGVTFSPTGLQPDSEVFTLTGNHTYTGTTLVSRGTLRLSGSGSTRMTQSVEVQRGATLGKR